MATDIIIRKLEPACRMLAEASNAQEAKKVVDIARAAEIYAKRQKLGEEAIQSANRVKIDAMTLLGEFLKQPGTKNEGGRPTKTPQNNGGVSKPTRHDLGIDYNESSDAQALAEIKETEPELFEEVREGKKTVRKARKEKQSRERRRKKMTALPDSSVAFYADQGAIIHGDCLTELPKQQEGSVRLAFADPPYNIGIDYGGGAKADRMPRQRFLDWCSEWMNAVSSLLTKDGSFWVLINDESAAEFKILLEQAGLFLRQWLIWYETFGVNNENGFNRTKRHIFWMVKNPKRFIFNADAVNRPSDRQTKYQDKRANPDGKNWDDVWGINPSIPRLTGTSNERMPNFPTQLPLALLRPIVACASEPGDLVLDPFCGSATTGVVCLETGRRFLGIEQNHDFAELANKRLNAAFKGGKTNV